MVRKTHCAACGRRAPFLFPIGDERYCYDCYPNYTEGDPARWAFLGHNPETKHDEQRKPKSDQ